MKSSYTLFLPSLKDIQSAIIEDKGTEEKMFKFNTVNTLLVLTHTMSFVRDKPASSPTDGTLLERANVQPSVGPATAVWTCSA